MRLSPFLWLVMSCGGPGGRSIPSPDDTNDPPDTDQPNTFPTATVPVLEASCELDPANALRVRCIVDVDPPTPVQIAFEPEDGSRPTLVRSGEASLPHHEIGLYFMSADTPYRWTASVIGPAQVRVDGVVTTGSLPAEVEDVIGVSTGTSTADGFLMLSVCSWTTAIVVDATGQVLWYEAPGQSFIESLILTEDDTLMAQQDSQIVHLSWMGDTLFDVTLEGATLHHDLFRKGGLNYALFSAVESANGHQYLMDGFHIFDDSGAVLETWKLIDHFTPPDDPLVPEGIIDYSHANAIFVQDDGDILLSFRHLSSVVKINGDLADPDFGEIRWQLTGDPSESDFPSDFSLTSSAGTSPDFMQQHNVHLRADGRLGMLDNRRDENGRVSILTLDESTMQADIEQSWELDLSCPFQGSAWPTSAGNPVGACATPRTAKEFDVNGGALSIYTLEMDCAGDDRFYAPRFIPLTF